MERIFNIDFNISLIDIGGISKGNFWMGGSSSWTWNCLLETAFRRQSSKETLYVQWRLEFGVSIWHRISSQQERSPFEIPTRAGYQAERAGLGGDENSAQSAA